jgi:hypothetical protein
MHARRRRLAAELRAPFRLVFRGGRDPESVDDTASTATIAPEVEFIAYCEDCMLSGRVRMAEERLSDLLNDHESFQLVDVLVTPLDGAPAIELGELLIAREELLLVHASGPRGNSARRQRTVRHPVVVKADPYEVRGSLHALPGGDPIGSFLRRKPMVALSDAVVRFRLAGQVLERRLGTVIVNRELIDWISEGETEQSQTLDVSAGEEAGPLLNDLSGDLLTR